MSTGWLRVFIACLGLSGCGALGPPPGLDRGTTDGPVGDAAAASAACPACLPTENCLAGVCYPAPSNCAALAALTPAAPDGVYQLNLSGTIQAAYCDMRTGRTLCTAMEADHGGATRDQAHVPFLLRSVLEPPEFCRIWAVRDEFGHPLDQLDSLDGAPEALVRSTCEALGFQGGDEHLKRSCRFGSNPGWGDCGFPNQVGRPVKVKWGNSCNCSEGHGRPFYTLEKGVFTSQLPWTFDGRVSAKCRIIR
jgi:hypothetical protein